MCQLEDTASPDIKHTRMAARPSMQADAETKKSKFSNSTLLSEAYLRDLHSRDELVKLTVPMLRQAVKLLNMVPSGTHKADLVAQLSGHFQ
ncbi:uncharacterized protein DEA37_0005738 [Paragonimus westermani]|uniref:SAP domain-containing protein n=1 Tax=Paragonimus westermani TaxID=34504 RepID=A0A5J4NV86_9TREM|nr:uncharacterized protein DEA37_0005738 [Paragonimus westermani]